MIISIIFYFKCGYYVQLTESFVKNKRSNLDSDHHLLNQILYLFRVAKQENIKLKKEGREMEERDRDRRGRLGKGTKKGRKEGRKKEDKDERWPLFSTICQKCRL